MAASVAHHGVIIGFMNPPGALNPDLAFFTTPPHDCGYLPGRQAVNLVADPTAPMSSEIYSTLAELGFRRSGAHVYRPHCPTCSRCVAVRIPVADFRPRRSQRRIAERNEDLTVHMTGSDFREEHYALYRRYIASRHGGGDMDTDDPTQYHKFLTSPWCDSRFVEFRDNSRLVSVAVVDFLRQGLSAVYTFFEPEQSRRGLGTLALLWQVEQARHLGLPWVFLGYWIADCPKMSYKADYRPLQACRNGKWSAFKAEKFPG